MIVIPRISFGSASCSARLAERWPLLKEVCGEVKARIQDLRSLPQDHLLALPEKHSEERLIRDKTVRFATYRESVGQGATLLVVQAFFSTLLHANYFPLGFGAGAFSGRIIVDGLLLTADGRVVQAPDELLWAFR